MYLLTRDAGELHLVVWGNWYHLAQKNNDCQFSSSIYNNLMLNPVPEGVSQLLCGVIISRMLLVLIVLTVIIRAKS